MAHRTHFKTFLPYLISLGILFIIALAYVNPVLDGKVLEQGDIIQSEGWAKEITDYKKETGEPPLWTNSMFGGMPAFLIDTEYKNNSVRLVLRSIFTLFTGKPLNVVLALGFCGFIMFCAFGVKPYISLIGGISMQLSTFYLISIEAGHNNKVWAIAFMALVIGGVALVYRRKWVLGFVLTMLGVYFELVSNHVQITYYLLMILFAMGFSYAIVHIFKGKIKDFAIGSIILLAAAFIAAGPNAAQLYTNMTHTSETIRGGKSELTKQAAQSDEGLEIDYAMRWSLGLKETLVMILPDIEGSSSAYQLDDESVLYKGMVAQGVPAQNSENFVANAPIYHGHQPFTSGPTYMGVIIFAFFIYGMFMLKNNLKWGLFAIGLLGLMLAWGRHFQPFFELFFYSAPFFDKFRNPSMAMVIPVTCFTIISLLMMNQFFKADKWGSMTKLFLNIAFGFVGVLLLIFGLFQIKMSFVAASDQSFLDNNQAWLVDLLHSQRGSLLRGNAVKGLLMLGVCYGLMIAVLKGKIKKQVAVYIVGVIVLVDMWMVGKTHFNNSDFKEERTITQNYLTPSQTDNQILTDTDIHYRVYNTTANPFNEAYTSYHHKSIGGYHPAKLYRYQDLIERHIGVGNMAVMNMLNTKYFIQNGANGKQIAQNPGALGNAWFVQYVNIVEDADKEMEALSAFNPNTEVVVDQRYEERITSIISSKDSTGKYPINQGANSSIVLSHYYPDEMTYTSNTQEPQFAVFSEIYYNVIKNGEELGGWRAYINNEPVDHIRVNYALRGMIVPAGQNEIVFKFEPDFYTASNNISGMFVYLFLILLVGGLGFSVFSYLKGNKKEEEMAEASTKK